VVLAAGAPNRHIPPSTVSTATRANDLIAWMKQSSLNRENLIQALDRVQQRAGAARKAFILPPVDTEGFVGRKTKLQRLIDLLINGTPPVGGRIVSVFGPPGVGKSGLAVHFAKTERERFPGGVLGVDLRGVEDPADAISRFATAQGEPLTPEEQVRPLHEIMQARFANRRCLLVLDNLEHGSALKRVKPGGQAVVLITCRNQDVLAQFAVPAANRIPLGALSPDEDPLAKGRIGRFLQRLRDADDPLSELVVDSEKELESDVPPVIRIKISMIQ
jgi:AAA domain